MRQTRIFALAAGLALAACTNQGVGRDEPVAEDRNVEDRTPYEQLDNVAQNQAEGYGGPGVAPVTGVQGGATVGGPLMATGQFQGVSGNPAPGSVTVTETANGTTLSILVNKYTANAQVQAVVVSGNCQNPGSVVQQVPQTIRTGNDGVGDVNAEVNIPTRQLLNGQHAIQLRAGQRVVGCADLPGQG